MISIRRSRSWTFPQGFLQPWLAFVTSARTLGTVFNELIRSVILETLLLEATLSLEPRVPGILVCCSTWSCAESRAVSGR